MKRQSGGRPPQGEVAKRAAIGLRVTPALRDQAERASQVTGRSLSQEIELRLEASFRDERLASLPPNSERTQNFFRRLQAVISIIEAATGKSWSEDGATSAAVRLAVNGLLDVDMPADPEWVEAFAKVQASPNDEAAEVFFAAIDERHKRLAMRALNAVIQIPMRHPGHVNPDGLITPIAGPRYMAGS